jgi:putative effector of murein hydrolase LrgA (UPF0299 family)
LYAVAAAWVPSTAGAVQVTLNLLFVPSGVAATLAMDGALGAKGPAEVVVRVVVADHGLNQVALAL